MARVTEHVPKLIDSTKFDRVDGDTEELRDNCRTGYKFTFGGSARGQSQFHHMVCISAMQDGNIEPANKLDFFHNCMAATTWDINDGHNLISLPTRQPYGHSDRDDVVNSARGALADAMAGIFGAIPDLPCHSNEHPAYTEAVIVDLKKNLWRPLARDQKKCKADGKSIRRQLRNASTAWRTFLTDRGAEHGGAALCWKNRNEPGYDAFWYIPFSMAPNPTKSTAPPDYDDRKVFVKVWLKTLFSL